MSTATVHMLSWFQIIALKNMYDNEIWPDRIGLVLETGNLIVEYKESVVCKEGIYDEINNKQAVDALIGKPSGDTITNQQLNK